MNTHKLHLSYRLSYQEAYDTFYLLSMRYSQTKKILIGALLSIITIVLLILYALDSRKLHYMYLATMSCLLLFYLIYQPVLKAKKGAGNVSKSNGHYEISLDLSGKIYLPDNTILDFKKDKHARFIETKNVFAIRIDKTNTLCIPKRILTEPQLIFVKKALDGTSI